MYSAICPLAIAPTMAPTFDNDPKSENCNTTPYPTNQPTRQHPETSRESGKNLREREIEITDDIILCGGRVATGESKLNRAKGDDESAEHDGDGRVSDDGGGGAELIHQA